MSEPRLSTATLSGVDGRLVDGRRVERPRYPRHFDKRICHLGIGRFHRAHQARVLHMLLQQGDADGWGLCAIGLRVEDRATLDALQAQDGLYTLTETDGDVHRVRVIGSIMQCVDATDDPRKAIAAIADAHTHIVSLTITEAGYCLDARGRLDAAHADIAHDLARPTAPRSAPALIVRALARRRDVAGRGLTLMSCDNLIDNGKRLRAAVRDFAQLADPGLAEWIDTHCRFPCSMVDRITPGADPAADRVLCEQLGVRDAIPVLSEDWLQWVLEDDFAGERPPFERAGVVLGGDVPAYERLKVGLLNGGHSAIAHLGLSRGYQGVHEAMADPCIRAWLARYLRDVAEVLDPPTGVDVEGYCAALIRRFSNPALKDTLLRLAQDSSMKFRQSLSPPLLTRLGRGLSIDAPARAIALWMTYLARTGISTSGYRDVEAARLLPLAHRGVEGDAPRDFVARALDLSGSALDRFSEAVGTQLRTLRDDCQPVVFDDRSSA